MKILALIDDSFIADNLRKIIFDNFGDKIKFDCRFSYNLNQKETANYKPINIQKETDKIISEYDLIFSLCSQIFPKKLVEMVRCINFHFGILPDVCGVTPIIFSIINNIPLGVTVHLMDEKIDNGDIIYQENIEAGNFDTAKEVEMKCREKLIEILTMHISDLIYKKYKTKKAEGKRQYFSLNDLHKTCKLDLNKETTLKDCLNLLRALQFGQEGLAYFISETGQKIKISLEFIKE